MSDDLIDRQYAIATAITGRTREIDGERWIRTSEVRESLKRCPSVEPKRKTGRWMHHEDKAYAGDGYEECSCCKWRCADWVFIEDSNYCPHCGAKMKGDTDETD